MSYVVCRVAQRFWLNGIATSPFRVANDRESIEKFKRTQIEKNHQHRHRQQQQQIKCKLRNALMSAEQR